MQPLLDSAHRRASRYLASLPDRSVAPTPGALEALKRFDRAAVPSLHLRQCDAGALRRSESNRIR